MFSEQNLGILLITGESLQREEEDPQDFCALRNLNTNTLAGASNHLWQSHIGRPELKILCLRESLLFCLFTLCCFQED